MIDFLKNAYYNLSYTKSIETQIELILKQYELQMQQYVQYCENLYSKKDNLTGDNKDRAEVIVDKLYNERNFFDTFYYDIVQNTPALQRTDKTRIAVDPIDLTTYGVFAKLINWDDMFSQDFITWYATAKQVQMYNCKTLPIFRSLSKLSKYTKSGEILKYFNSVILTFNKNYRAFFSYINDNDGDEDFTNKIVDAYNNTFTYNDDEYLSFKEAYDKLWDDFTDGFVDLNDLLETIWVYFDDLQLALKVISAGNIAFYSDSEDEDTLNENATNNFKFLTLDVDIDKAAEDNGINNRDVGPLRKRLKTIYGISLVVPTAIKAKSKVNSTMSNSNKILWTVINNTFIKLGINDDFTKIETILKTQSLDD